MQPASQYCHLQQGGMSRYACLLQCRQSAPPVQSPSLGYMQLKNALALM